MLQCVTDERPDIRVQVANGASVAVECVGSVSCSVQTSGGEGLLTLTGVLVVPGFVHNLFSCEWGWLHDGVGTQLNNERRLVLPTGAHVPFLPQRGKYLIKTSSPKGGVSALATTSLDHDELTHARLAHFSVSRVRAAIGKVTGIDLSKFKGHENCDACAKGSIRGQRFSKKNQVKQVFTFFGECIATDLCGPFPASVPIGFTYAIIFFDRYSKYISIYYLKSKEAGGAKAAMLQFIKDHHNWLKQGRVWSWLTDNGKEFMSSSLDEFCTEFLIKRLYSVPYRSNTNASAERAWGIMLRPVRILASTLANGEQWWPFLMHQTCMIHNSLPTRGHDPPTAPIAVANPKVTTPDLSMLRVMLCRCIAKVHVLPKAMITHKLTANGYEGVYLGYDERRRGHFVYVLELNRIQTVANREVEFREDEPPKTELEGPRAIHFSFGDTTQEMPAPGLNLHEPREQRHLPPGTTGHRPRAGRAAPLPQGPAIPWHGAMNDQVAENMQGMTQELLPEQTFAYSAQLLKMDRALVDVESSARLAWCSSSLYDETVCISLSKTEPIVPKLLANFSAARAWSTRPGHSSHAQ